MKSSFEIMHHFEEEYCPLTDLGFDILDKFYESHQVFARPIKDFLLIGPNITMHLRTLGYVE